MFSSFITGRSKKTKLQIGVLFSAGVAVKTFYLAMRKYFSGEGVTIIHEEHGCFTYLKINEDSGLIWDTVHTVFPYQASHPINRLTIAPHVTLMGVSSVQDGFKSHPFYGYLKDKNRSIDFTKSTNRL